jgi:hypothetical protein
MGGGLFTLKLNGLETVPTGNGLLTVTFTVAADEMSSAEIIALSCVLFM